MAGGTRLREGVMQTSQGEIADNARKTGNETGSQPASFGTGKGQGNLATRQVLS